MMSSTQSDSASQSQSSNQLEFSQAMTDFKIMFPNMDVEVIEAVLRSNNGAVDATIDQLLTMTADIEDLPDATGAPPEYSTNTLPTYREAVKLDSVTDMLGASSLREPAHPDLLSGLDMMGASGGRDVSGDDPPLCSIKQWLPPLLGKLPSDFLRLKVKHGHSYSHPDRPVPTSSGAGEAPVLERRSRQNDRNHQLLEDEKFAMMLQNEEFMRELRGNQEFMSALEEDHYEPVYNNTEVLPPDKPRRPHLGMDDALFREKLKNMGKTSKQKFAKLATMFSRQRGAARVLGQAAPSKDNLLLNAHPLANTTEDSDSEEDGHCTTKVSPLIRDFSFCTDDIPSGPQVSTDVIL